MKKIVQYDKRTGEMQDGVLVLVPRRTTNGFVEGWIAVAQPAARLFAQRRKELGEEGFAVLFMLIAKLNFENHLAINQTELGLELGMLRQNVQRSIKRLIAMGILLEGPKEGQNRSYRFNPNFGWKGSGENHKKALREHREERMKAAKITGVIENQDLKPQPNEDK